MSSVKKSKIALNHFSFGQISPKFYEDQRAANLIELQNIQVASPKLEKSVDNLGAKKMKKGKNHCEGLSASDLYGDELIG